MLWRNLLFANQVYEGSLTEDIVKYKADKLLYIEVDIVLLQKPSKLFMIDNGLWTILCVNINPLLIMI